MTTLVLVNRMAAKEPFLTQTPSMEPALRGNSMAARAISVVTRMDPATTMAVLVLQVSALAGNSRVAPAINEDACVSWTSSCCKRFC
jgi:hypothetical protein